MDWITYKKTAQEYLNKYKYIVLILLVGIFLMVMPDQKKDAVVIQDVITNEEKLGESLGRMLSLVAGAGKVEVLLSEATGPQTVYQQNENRSKGKENSEIHTDTVLVSDTGRNETGLITQINPPVYQGAIILSQGAENPAVRLSLVQAVKSITGLSSDRITVLKMK